ncbi:MAG: hypothetical protein IPM32_18230 [Ignavibacteriae bacterium]|nr:hypothetical protein [Ignavibacteriota bacterium]
MQKTSRTIETYSKNEYEENLISVYNHSNGLSQSVVIEQTEKILIAFPKLERPFINLLRERFKANNFSDERMIDSVNYVIDNYTGFDKLPQVADFIKYDRKVRVYSHAEVTQYNLWRNVEAIDIGLSNPRWIKKEDFEKYKFKKWIKK